VAERFSRVSLLTEISGFSAQVFIVKQFLACVAGGSGYPRELRSRTRVQKAAQVARRMGRSLVELQAGISLPAMPLAGELAASPQKGFAREPTPVCYAG